MSHKSKKAAGFTLVELMVAVLISIIVVFAIGMVMAEGPRGFKDSYERAYSDVVTQSYVAQRFFDATVRKASSSTIVVGDGKDWIEVSYYTNEDVAFPNRFVRIYLANEQLMAQMSQLGTSGDSIAQDRRTICENVSDCYFNTTGRSVHMILKLDDGNSAQTVVTSAVMHNY